MADYRGRPGVAAASLILGLILGLNSAAQAQPAAVHPCASQPDARERLACYDRAFPPQAAPPGEAASAAAAAAAERFGLPVAPAKTAPELERLSARVVSSGRMAGGDRVYVLDNGQRWRQLDHASTIYVADGELVHIERAAMGGFRLVTAAGSALRVRRLP